MDDPLVGTKINRYEVLDCLHKTELLGLFKVFDTKLERNVLMKLVFHSSSYSHEFIEYFLSEARSLAKLSHPNIARVLDFGYDGGNLYLISEYHSGRTIAELMTKPIPWQRVIETLIPMADALSYAHGQGIIHRDLKPENIVITDDDRLMLNDFSLIRMIESEETRDMTGTNVGLGSPAYISPEQGKGLQVDFRSDIYSLGIIFFEMITGQKPFSGGTSMEMVIQHVTAPPPSPRRLVPDLPDFVEAIILTALSKDVDQRYQTMDACLSALRTALARADGDVVEPPTRSNPRLLIGISALVITLLALGAMYVRFALSEGSTTATPGAEFVSSASAAPTIAASSTPTPELPTVSPTPHNTFPITAFSLAEIPVLQFTPVPAGSAVINTQNVGSLVELARWGNPDVSQFAFIKGEQVLLAATSAGVYYFDPASLTPRYFFDAKGSLTTFAVSADEEWVATGDTKGNIYVWSIKDGSEIAAFQSDPKPIRSLDFSPDRSMLVSSAVGKTARVWDLQQKNQLAMLEGHALDINRVLFSPKGDTVISAGDDFKVIVWDVYSGAILKKLTAAKKINDMSLSSDGNTVAIALSNATIEIWDLRSDSRINTIRSAEVVEPSSFIQFLPSDQLIITGATDGIVRVWNVQSPDMLWQTSYQDATGASIRQSAVKSIAVTDKGAKFVTLFEDGHAELWNLTDQKLERTEPLNFSPIKRVSISPNGGTVAYQRGESVVSIWSFPNAEHLSDLNAVIPRGNPFSQDSKQLLLHSGRLDLYSLTQAVPTLVSTYLGIPAEASVNFFQEDSIVAAAAGNVVKYWSTASGMELRPGDENNDGSCRIIYSRDGAFLAAGSANGLIGIEQNASYFCQAPRGTLTTSESYLADGSIIALSQENQTVQIWNLRSGDQAINLPSEQPGEMLGVAVSDDGLLLATASASGVVEIYDLITMKSIGSLNLHTGPVNHVLFSHDGKYIITGSADGTVRFFGIRP